MSLVTAFDQADQRVPASLASEVKAEVPLKEKIARATIEWITALHDSEVSSRAAFKQSREAVRHGVWYPSVHYQAVRSLGNEQSALKKHFSDLSAHACGYVPRNFFTHIVDSGNHAFKGRRIMHFMLGEGAIPSEAMKAAKEGLSVIDCGVACQIARYGALLDVLGERKFNILFGSSPRGQRMNIGYKVDDHLQPMQYFVDFTRAAKEAVYRFQLNSNPEKITGEIGNRPIALGQMVEIRGVLTHRQKHPWKANSGYNLFCSDDTPGNQQFIGLGIKGSEKELNAHLLNSYNEAFSWDVIPEELRSQESQYIADQFKNDQAECLDIYYNEGFNLGSMQDFKLPLIEELIKLPEDQVSMDFVRNFK